MTSGKPRSNTLRIAARISGTTSKGERPNRRARSVVMPCTRAAPSGIAMPGSTIQSLRSTTAPVSSITPTWAVTIRAVVVSTPVVSRSNTPSACDHPAAAAAAEITVSTVTPSSSSSTP